MDPCTCPELGKIKPFSRSILKLKTNQCCEKGKKLFFLLQPKRKEMSNYGEIYGVVCLAQDKCRDCSDIGFYPYPPLLRKSRKKLFACFSVFVVFLLAINILQQLFPAFLSHNHFQQDQLTLSIDQVLNLEPDITNLASRAVLIECAI
jgi:hypothetical protein